MWQNVSHIIGKKGGYRLFSLNRRMTFAFTEVLGKIRFKIELANSGPEVSSIRKMKADEILVKLGQKVTDKITFCGAVKRLLGVKALISS